MANTNEQITRLIWKCKECDDVVISYSNIIHKMDFCDCGKSGVDLEVYQKNQGFIEEISRKRLINGVWKPIKINKN